MANEVARLDTARNALSTGILNPTNLEEAMKMAEVLCKSSIIPKDYQGNPGNVLVAMQWGMELGLPPLQAMQNIAVINGRPCLWGDAMIALVRDSSICEYVYEEMQGEGDNLTAVCKSKRRDEEKEHVRTFSVADAKTAGLWQKVGPWKTSPKRMLQMRARGFNLRDVFTDILRGMSSAEEQYDIEKYMGSAERVDQRNHRPEPKPEIQETVSEDQIKQLQEAAEAAGKDAEFVCNVAKVNSLAELKVSRFAPALNYLKGLKAESVQQEEAL